MSIFHAALVPISKHNLKVSSEPIGQVRSFLRSGPCKVLQNQTHSSILPWCAPAYALWGEHILQLKHTSNYDMICSGWQAFPSKRQFRTRTVMISGKCMTCAKPSTREHAKNIANTTKRHQFTVRGGPSARKPRPTWALEMNHGSTAHNEVKLLWY